MGSNHIRTQSPV